MNDSIYSFVTYGDISHAVALIICLLTLGIDTISSLSFKFLVKGLQYFTVKVLFVIRIVVAVAVLVITGRYSTAWLTCNGG